MARPSSWAPSTSWGAVEGRSDYRFWWLVVEGEVECIYACSSHVWSAQGVRELAVLQNTRGLTAPESESATSFRAAYHVPFDNEAAATFLVYRNNNNVGGPWHSAAIGVSPAMASQNLVACRILLPWIEPQCTRTARMFGVRRAPESESESTYSCGLSRAIYAKP